MVIFRSQKGSATKKVWETLLYSTVVAGASSRLLSRLSGSRQ